MKKTNRVSLVVIALFALCSSQAFATVQLRLSDGTVPGTVVVVDQGPGDSNPDAGIVLYIGPVGPNWTVNVSSGLSKPTMGNALVPQMDLGTANFSSLAPGVLTVELTDTDFLANGTGEVVVGGTTDGNVTIRTYADASNTPFGKTTQLSSQGPFGPGPFSGETTTATVGTGSPYSLTIAAEINHRVPGSTGFDVEIKIKPSARGGCRVTGGSNHQTNSFQSPCISTPLPTHISHGGQVGAPFSVGTPFTPNSTCISGEWEHNRHLKGNSLVGVLHASGNGHEHQFDSLLCACLPCDENPGAVGLVGEVCNPGQRICGPLPRKAPANKICFSGVADYTFTTGNKTVKAVFRVDIEDRSEGNSQSSAPPPDRYRIRIWLLDPSCGRNPDPNSAEAMAIRFAASADPNTIAVLATTENLKVNIPPDIDDGGDMTQGNHQIHPQTGAQCDAVAVIAGAHLDSSTQVAPQSDAASFGIVAFGLQTTQNPAFIYRTTITNCGWETVTNLTVITGTDSATVDTTLSYFAPGAVLRPGGTVTRYYTNVWSEDTSTSVTVLGTSLKNGTPAISASSAMAIVGVAGPSGVSARVARGKIIVSWNALPNASSYNIKRATTSGGPYDTIRTGQTTTSYTDNTADSGAIYYYVVSAIKSGSETLNSEEASVEFGTGGSTGSTGGGGGGKGGGKK
jgi:hypothetical protein